MNAYFNAFESLTVDMQVVIQDKNSKSIGQGSIKGSVVEGSSQLSVKLYFNESSISLWYFIISKHNIVSILI